jgi:hypothetical protein
MMLRYLVHQRRARAPCGSWDISRRAHEVVHFLDDLAVLASSKRSPRKASEILCREPFGRPFGLPDWPGLNLVASFPSGTLRNSSLIPKL